MPAEGHILAEVRLRSPQPQGSISVYEPAQQLEETSIASTGGTVSQIRIELEDHTAGVGDDPQVNLAIYPAQGTCTADTGTDIITTGTAHGRVAGDRVTFSTTGTLPAPLVAGTSYYVESAPSTTEMKLATAPGGSVINITTTGSGTHSWRGYGQTTVSTAYGSGTSNVVISEGLDGEDSDYDTLRVAHFKLSRNDPDNAAASAQVVVEIGNSADTFHYVRVPLAFDVTAHTDAAALIAIPGGITPDPAYPVKVTIIASDNAQLLIALQGT